MSRAMTDEALSDLAEMLIAACAGRRLAPFSKRAPPFPGRALWSGTCCPLGAAVGEEAARRDLEMPPGAYPNPHVAALLLGIPDPVAYGLAMGFDGLDYRPDRVDRRAWDLGRLLRLELA